MAINTDQIQQIVDRMLDGVGISTSSVATLVRLVRDRWSRGASVAHIDVQQPCGTHFGLDIVPSAFLDRYTAVVERLRTTPPVAGERLVSWNIGTLLLADALQTAGIVDEQANRIDVATLLHAMRLQHVERRYIARHEGSARITGHGTATASLDEGAADLPTAADVAGPAGLSYLDALPAYNVAELILGAAPEPKAAETARKQHVLRQQVASAVVIFMETEGLLHGCQSFASEPTRQPVPLASA